MRTIRIIEHVSLDGVMQNTADDDGFPYTDWTAAYRSPQGREAVLAAYGDKYDLLLGRRTYDLWTTFWPKATDAFAAGINAATKYVVTHRPESLAWGPVAGVGPDVVADLRRIKASDGPDIMVAGSSTLIATLLEADLADEVLLIVYPVVVGRGKRVFADGAPARALELVSSSAMPTGIIFNVYRVAGQLKTA